MIHSDIKSPLPRQSPNIHPSRKDFPYCVEEWVEDIWLYRHPLSYLRELGKKPFDDIYFWDELVFHGLHPDGSPFR